MLFFELAELVLVQNMLSTLVPASWALALFQGQIAIWIVFLGQQFRHILLVPVNRSLLCYFLLQISVCAIPYVFFQAAQPILKMSCNLNSLSKAINAPQMCQTTFSWLKHQTCVNSHHRWCFSKYRVVTIRWVAKIIIKLRGESGLNLQLTLLSWAVHPINAAINTEQALLKCSIINYSR